jgi:deazaflavin-dependent oxidoreductase (nitroreductase family)
MNVVVAPPRRGAGRLLGGLILAAAVGAAAYLIRARPWQHAPAAPAPAAEANTGRSRGLDPVRRFNKYILNPLTLRFAGSRIGPYSVVQHVGRRSGHAYATPVVARPMGEHFFMPLPYGANVDWCRNVLAAGQATVEYQGQSYAVVAPEVVGQEDGLPAFPPGQQWLYRRLGFPQFLRVMKLDDAPTIAVPDVV